MVEKLTLRVKPLTGFCLYCLKPVGIVGNWIARWMGTSFHECDFSNVLTPEERRTDIERQVRADHDAIGSRVALDIMGARSLGKRPAGNRERRG